MALLVAFIDSVNQPICKIVDSTVEEISDIRCVIVIIVPVIGISVPSLIKSRNGIPCTVDSVR